MHPACPRRADYLDIAISTCYAVSIISVLLRKDNLLSRGEMELFLDVETTGLPLRRDARSSDLSNWPRLVSIAWALAKGRSIFKNYGAIVCPDGFTIPDDAVKVHGITTARARREGRPLRDVINRLNDDIETHAPHLLVCHNLAFDRPVVAAEAIRLKARNLVESLDGYCTMEKSVQLCRIPRNGGGYKWPSLIELHRHLFGTAFANPHDALSDVLACAKCYFAVVDGARSSDEDEEQTKEDGEARDIIETILDWAEDHPNFDTAFVENLSEQLEERGTLTANQMQALYNIVERWHIE